jgi:hypothetical protein
MPFKGTSLTRQPLSSQCGHRAGKGGSNMNMKKIFLLGLIVALTLTENSFAGGPTPDWKETEISRLVALPPKINVVPPGKDLSPKIAAFLGRWEGVWDFIDMPVVLIVESISSATANVIYCTGKSKWGNRPDYSHRKAKVLSEEKIEFPIWGYDGGSYTANLTLKMGEDLKILHGVFQGRKGKLSIIMKKIED